MPSTPTARPAETFEVRTGSMTVLAIRHTPEGVRAISQILAGMGPDGRRAEQRKAAVGIALRAHRKVQARAALDRQIKAAGGKGVIGATNTAFTRQWVREACADYRAALAALGRKPGRPFDADAIKATANTIPQTEKAA